MRVGLGTTTHCLFLVQFDTKQGEKKDSTPKLSVSSVNRHIKFENLPGTRLMKLCSRPGVSSHNEHTEPDVLLVGHSSCAVQNPNLGRINA